MLSHLNYIKDNEAINVLITGESGVGKELIARYIHGLSKKGRPFIVVNCAAIPNTLIESVLFGHKKGSFTGAHEDRSGKFELAHGGDVFLDEVSTLSEEMQTRFLRVLQEGEIERIGSHTTRKVQFRVIAATNEDLDDLVTAKKFRLDLYHRLRGFSMVIPPLRERIKDIDLLIDHYIKNTDIKLTEEVRKVFRGYSWPGNVRELKNFMKTIIALKKKGKVLLSDLPVQFTSHKEAALSFEKFYDELFEKAKEQGLKVVLDDIEKAILEQALRTTKNQLDCAQLIKTSPPTVSRRIKEFGLRKILHN